MIDWDPRHLYRKLLPDEASIEGFLTTICTREWNERQDEGRPWAEAVAELIERHPTQRSLIEAYWRRWPEMIRAQIDATVTIADELKNRGVPLFGLTNWSAETFPVARQRFDFIRWFDGIVVSGEEGIMKPNPEIFRRLLDRYGLRASDALFVDDSPVNVQAAVALDIQGHHFRSADVLRQHLVESGLL